MYYGRLHKWRCVWLSHSGCPHYEAVHPSWLKVCQCSKKEAQLRSRYVRRAIQEAITWVFRSIPTQQNTCMGHPPEWKWCVGRCVREGGYIFTSSAHLHLTRQNRITATRVYRRSDLRDSWTCISVWLLFCAVCCAVFWLLHPGLQTASFSRLCSHAQNHPRRVARF